MNLIDQVIIAKDVKVFPLRGEWTESEDQASVRGHITLNNPYQNRVKNKIESYKDIYDGDMFKFVDFTDAYAAMSRMGEFGDGQKAVLHLEDENGAYRDMLFPSMRVIGEQGESEHFDRMVRKHWMGINSIWRLLKRREKDFHDFVDDKAAYYSRCWYFLYKDPEIEYAMHSGIHYDPDKEHVYVELEFGDEDIKDIWELIVRLPEVEISEVTVTNPKEFDLNTLKTETVGKILQRLRRDSDVIIEMARTGADPNHTEEDMNALRDKIDGRIIRKLVDFCPYCHENLLDERAYFVVRVPVQFYMHSGNFGIYEDDVYQKVTEAVQAGKVTGKCEHCGHELTSEDINKTKDGWKWRWRPKNRSETQDKILGKIVRNISAECPHCHKSLFNQTRYMVEIPVKFYADCSEFYLYEKEMYQSVTEAVQAGKVTGECEHCGHILTADDINAAKSGWQYRWRYDSHM